MVALERSFARWRFRLVHTHFSPVAAKPYLQVNVQCSIEVIRTRARKFLVQGYFRGMILQGRKQKIFSYSPLRFSGHGPVIRLTNNRLMRKNTPKLINLGTDHIHGSTQWWVTPRDGSNPAETATAQKNKEVFEKWQDQRKGLKVSLGWQVVARKIHKATKGIFKGR